AWRATALSSPYRGSITVRSGSSEPLRAGAADDRHNQILRPASPLRRDRFKYRRAGRVFLPPRRCEPGLHRWRSGDVRSGVARSSLSGAAQETRRCQRQTGGASMRPEPALSALRRDALSAAGLFTAIMAVAAVLHFLFGWW